MGVVMLASGFRSNHFSDKGMEDTVRRAQKSVVTLLSGV